MNRNGMTLVAAVATFMAIQASAQEIYLGGGLAYTSGESEATSFDAETAELDAGMLSLILGQRFAAGKGYWGWETSADLSFGAETETTPSEGVCEDDGADGPYLCEHNATLRLVGIYGTALGEQTEVFGSLGLGMLIGDYANAIDSVESATTYGATVGVGLNRKFANGLVGRGEVIYDSFTNDTQEDYSSEYEGTTVRFGLLRSF